MIKFFLLCQGYQQQLCSEYVEGHCTTDHAAFCELLVTIANTVDDLATNNQHFLLRAPPHFASSPPPQ